MPLAGFSAAYHDRTATTSTAGRPALINSLPAPLINDRPSSYRPAVLRLDMGPALSLRPNGRVVPTQRPLSLSVPLTNDRPSSYRPAVLRVDMGPALSLRPSGRVLTGQLPPCGAAVLHPASLLAPPTNDQPTSYRPAVLRLKQRLCLAFATSRLLFCTGQLLTSASAAVYTSALSQCCSVRCPRHRRLVLHRPLLGAV